MTPIEHAGCGLAAGGIVAPAIHRFLKVPFWVLYIMAFVAAMLPDIDGLSLFFSHAVYFGKLWYSHHMFFHSFTAAAVVSLVLSLIYITGATGVRGTRNLFRHEKVLLEYKIRRIIGAFLIVFIGYTVHFLGDLPTPPGPWGGINLFWPSKEMSGGWGLIWWHNWYIIYLAIRFMIMFSIVALVAGILSSIPFRYVRWTGYGVRGVTVIIALVFAWQTYSFISSHSCKEMGFEKWDKLNRSLVPPQYIKNADKYLNDASIFWRKQVIKRDDLIKLGNKALAAGEAFHRAFSPYVGMIVPSTSSASDLALYHELQSLSRGMDDTLEGDYRVWILRDSFPSPEFFNRGFLVYYNSSRNTFYLQMTNAWLLVFHIEERDASGKALRVKKITHTNKLFVPDTQWPQLNPDELKKRTFNFWDQDMIPYNLVPKHGVSRYQNTVHGLYPSMNTTPGYIYPGWQTGVALHDGVYSEGCTVLTFGHLDLGSLLQNPYYPLWKSADRIIDIESYGSKFRGKQKVWGRCLYVRYPEKFLSSKVALGK